LFVNVEFSKAIVPFETKEAPPPAPPPALERTTLFANVEFTIVTFPGPPETPPPNARVPRKVPLESTTRLPITLTEFKPTDSFFSG
jgi:hypothetical protein